MALVWVCAQVPLARATVLGLRLCLHRARARAGSEGQRWCLAKFAPAAARPMEWARLREPAQLLERARAPVCLRPARASTQVKRAHAPGAGPAARVLPRPAGRQPAAAERSCWACSFRGCC